MNNLVWRNIGRFVLLMLLQLLVLNYVSLGGYVMPMLYVLFILMLPTSMKRLPMLLTAFGTGLLIDIMAGALGFHALACTVVAMMRITFADRILTRGENVVVETPSIFSVTPQYFISYLLLLIGAFYLVFYTLELFGFRGFGGVLLATVCSTLVTTLLVVLYQVVFVRRKEVQS
ncbi:MAG: rod shape-determining protein MreD [Bacteroidales bacterium]|nr:rod shape-determining protein MreD [Bacteroidales bacterium]